MQMCFALHTSGIFSGIFVTLSDIICNFVDTDCCLVKCQTIIEKAAFSTFSILYLTAKLAGQKPLVKARSIIRYIFEFL